MVGERSLAGIAPQDTRVGVHGWFRNSCCYQTSVKADVRISIQE
jgi:hypothetical protein